MLLEDLYNVVDSKLRDQNSVECTVNIHPNHDIFKGHFPDFPVTPGVVMLQILKNCLEQQLQYSLVLK